MLPPSSAARTAILAEDALVHVHVHKVPEPVVPAPPQGLLVCLLTRCVGNTQTTPFGPQVDLLLYCILHSGVSSHFEV